jgi:hypothetical protein
MYFGSLETDPTKPIFVRIVILHLREHSNSHQGVEPLFFYGFCTVGCVGTRVFEQKFRFVSDCLSNQGPVPL